MQRNFSHLMPMELHASPNSSNSSNPTPVGKWEAPTFTRAALFRVGATLVLFLFAAVSNLAVLISVVQGRGRRLAAHLRPLIMSLAVADLMMTFIVMPLDMVWNITVQWYAGDAMCKLLCFLKLFAMHSSAFILVVISLDRHHAILHPLDSVDAKRRNKKMLMLAWALSLLLASPQLFIFRAIKAEGVDFTQCITHGSFRQRWHETVYNMFHFVTLYVIPLLVMTCCYIRILVEINRQIHKRKDRDLHLRCSGTDMIPKARMKTLKMTIIIVLSFVVCWTPYYLLGIWYWFQPQMLQVTPEYVHHILFVFGNLNTCCDPVIYGFYTPSFRADLAGCWCCRSRDSSPRSLDRLSGRPRHYSVGPDSDAPSGDQQRGTEG
ncbi:gonadotropin-releasing hormone II receptor-like [Brienomyrus brachyistius]|uniref:gonadotropin-releasing hormone II receptor-like n=1 Tax=Brienomyrus brachyistius TaxID=42636 RepID=UPI0020B24042|nr:gonadotropin-releasing hormone II receptor-like [Brienomyrus brachyistius]